MKSNADYDDRRKQVNREGGETVPAMGKPMDGRQKQSDGSAMGSSNLDQKKGFRAGLVSEGKGQSVVDKL